MILPPDRYVCDYAALNAALHKNEKKKKVADMTGAYLCFPVPMLPSTDVPRCLCSPVPMFPGFCTLIVVISINRLQILPHPLVR